MTRIGVIGAGAWGSALANLLAGKGHEVCLWAWEKDVAEDIRNHRCNGHYLPDTVLSAALETTNDLKEAVKDAEVVLLVVPTQHVRSILSGFAAELRHDAIICTAAKGIERGSLKTVSAIISECTLNPVAVLSGPSFAREVAAKKPTAVTLAIKDTALGFGLQDIFNTEYFRVYTHDDLLGAELGGALKNVIAIAAGIADGLQLGLNARAALITRGLAEMVRLGTALGASSQTFSGLSGLGDLVLTCTGNLSRNYTVGLKLGQGFTIEEILFKTRTVAEGVETSDSAYALSNRSKVEMPIVEQVYQVIHKGKKPATAVWDLMARQPKNEFS